MTVRLPVGRSASGSFSGAPANPAVSANAAHVAFDSFRAVDHPNPPGGFTILRNVFLLTRETSRLEQVSLGPDGSLPNNFSRFLAISADGRYAAFGSSATNLVPGDTNGVSDVFVRDRATGTVERASVAGDGAEANAASGISYSTISISGDGRYVAFQSDASNLVPDDGNGTSDIFVRDRVAGVTERVSVSDDGTEANNSSGRPSISDDGRYVSFDSFAHNLVPGEADGCRLPVGSCGEADVFVHDRDSERTERVSVSSAGVGGDQNSWGSSISGDGRHVAFYSSATNLVGGDSNGDGDVFVHDRRAGVTELVSVSGAGELADNRSDGVFGQINPPTLSADGRHVAFRSLAANLVGGDTNGQEDAFVRDRGPAIGVADLAAAPVDGRLSVSGWAAFSGATIASAADPAGDTAGDSGGADGDLTAAELVYRPEQEDLLVRVDYASLREIRIGTGDVDRPCVPGAICAPPVGTSAGVGLPQLRHAIGFEVGGARYEIRVSRDTADVAANPGAQPRFLLYRCATTCAEAGPLAGGLGTTGQQLRASLPLAAVGLQTGAVISAIRVSTAVGSDPSTVDEMRLPDVRIPTHAVQLGVGPVTTAAGGVTFGPAGDLSDGRFSATLPMPPRGTHRVWARACLAEECGLRSVDVTSVAEVIETSLQLSAEAVRSDLVATATLTQAEPAAPVAGAEIAFFVNGTPVGTASTGPDGHARLTLHRRELKRGDTLRVQFAGDEEREPSSAELVR